MGTASMNKTRPRKRPQPSQDASEEPSELPGEEPEAVTHLKQAIRSGVEWQRALLEAVGRWTLPEEDFQGRHYQYLVRDEAFDWLLLAERLCCELDGMVPVEEKEQLLFHGSLPDSISAADFRELMGFSKHRAFLNYWYGVVVEEALQLAVEDEVRKQHRARGLPDSEDLAEEAFVRIYEHNRTHLLKRFLKENGSPGRRSISVGGMKEFTYWLFKRRLKLWDPARVASDTRKALDQLERLRASNAFPRP